MRTLFFTLVVLYSDSTSAQQWSLPDAAYSGAEAAREASIHGGDDALIAAIKKCHASVSVKTAFNTVTARCFAMDMAGTLMAMKIAKDRGVEDIPAFYRDEGTFLTRCTPYFMFVPQDQLDPIMQITKESVLEAIPRT